MRCCITFQFTPLREGRHRDYMALDVSELFQFTPLREGRPAASSNPITSFYFNSRPSARGDLPLPSPIAGSKFQFTPLREGRRQPLLRTDNTRLFQFTPLREGRLIKTGIFCQHINFNSRPSARGDLFDAQATYAESIFQFTPLREGRHAHGQRGVFALLISIHAPPRGATFTESTINCATENFNSRPSARGDEAEPDDSAGGNHFNSRPSARGDVTLLKSGGNCIFQFTPLREGRR